MNRCPTCGTELAANARFCPKDGTTLRPDTPPAAPVFARGEVGRKTKPLKTQGRVEDDPLVGAIIDGRYRVRGRLGQGGVGAVYEGEHTETKRPVAVKVLHAVFAGTEEFHRRFEREARAASKLSHPACVSVIDYGRVDKVEPITAGAKLLGIPYLVMELVRGRSLAERLDEPIEPVEAVIIARGVASALKHAHGLGIVHRDVKPANVMLVEDGGTGRLTKLLDFGLAKVMGDSDGGGPEPLTQAGTVFGTPGYLSPEQAGGLPADARSDVYALGIMMYEMVVGRRPFVRPDPLEVVRDHLSTPPPSPRSLGASISEPLEAAILKALAKDAQQRWQTADEFSRALGATPEGRGQSVGQAVPQEVAAERSATVRMQAAWRRVRNDRRLMALGGLAIGAMAAMTLLLLTMAKRHTTVAQPAPLPPPVVAPLVPEGARTHLREAEAYQRKLWCSDALEELDRALRDAPGLRSDATVTRVAIACLTPKTRDKAIRFVSERLGSSARAALTQAATNDPNLEVRRGARAALERLPN